MSTYLHLDFDGVVYPRFPQCVAAIVEWFCNREDIIQGLVGMTGDTATPAEIKQSFKQVAPLIIQHDPRKLYEFFDDQDIKISVCTHMDTDSLFVSYNSVEMTSSSYGNRKDAEENAFLGAFNLLEKRLVDEKIKGNNG